MGACALFYMLIFNVSQLETLSITHPGIPHYIGKLTVLYGSHRLRRIFGYDNSTGLIKIHARGLSERAETRRNGTTRLRRWMCPIGGNGRNALMERQMIVHDAFPFFLLGREHSREELSAMSGPAAREALPVLFN